MILLTPSITDHAITVRDVLFVSTVAVCAIALIGLVFIVGSIIMKGWNH